MLQLIVSFESAGSKSRPTGFFLIPAPFWESCDIWKIEEYVTFPETNRLNCAACCTLPPP